MLSMRRANRAKSDQYLRDVFATRGRHYRWYSQSNHASRGVRDVSAIYNRRRRGSRKRVFPSLRDEIRMEHNYEISSSGYTLTFS